MKIITNFVSVVHSAFNFDYDKEGKLFTTEPKLVALVDVADREGDSALEYVFCVTQNIEGSWSQGEELEPYGDQNPDYNSAITVVEPLPKDNGRTYGHRSTSVGDRLVFNGTIYRVASSGFEIIKDFVENDERKVQALAC